MDAIRFFFEVNRSILFFVYGLAFFVLGLATALQSRQYSRLDLARTLKWLAAFGLIHGLHEWGDVFIPIQGEYVSQFAVEMLHRLHLVLLGVSFACLMEFGVALYRTLGAPDWLNVIPGSFLAVWFFVCFFPLTSLFEDFMTWHDVTNATARYFIGFPGSMLAAFGLRAHAMQRIKKLNVPHIIRMLRVAGISLFLYGVFSGLITPPIPLFPGNMLNYEVVKAAIAFPVQVFRALIGFVMTVSFIRAMEIFDVEIDRMIEEMEQEQIRSAERNRLSRELHDGVIQKVYTAGLVVESARRMSVSEGGELTQRLENAQTILKDAVEDLRSNLVGLYQPSRRKSLRKSLKELIKDPRFETFVNIGLRVDLPEDASLAPVRADHVVAVVNEALHNVVRHAQATEVQILVSSEGGDLHVEITDDGVGLPDELTAGYGLRNMRDRARMLGGEMKVEKIEDGTKVQLDIPWEDVN